MYVRIFIRNFKNADRPMRKSYLNQRGLTLVEILVVLAIMASMLGLATGLFMGRDRAAVSEAAQILAATLRYTYNEAATTRQYYRLLIDFDQQQYVIESSNKPFTIDATNEGSVSAPPSSGSEEPSEENPEAESGEGFSKVSQYLIKPYKFSGRVRIKDVYVAHAKKFIEEGKTAIYFFPNGWVEKSIINLTDEKGENVYSLETYTMSGQVKVRNSYREYNPEKSTGS